MVLHLQSNSIVRMADIQTKCHLCQPGTDNKEQDMR